MDRSVPAGLEGDFVMYVDSIKSRTSSMIDDQSNLSRDLARDIIATYAAGVSQNFIVWLSALLISARSLEARFAAEENIRAEISENHPKMLMEFAKSSGSIPKLHHFDSVKPVLECINNKASEFSSLYLLSLVHGLEELSLIYIPWLAELSRSLNGTDFRYAEIHGVADIHHADQLQKALIAEARFFRNPALEIETGYMSALYFVESLLCIRK